MKTVARCYFAGLSLAALARLGGAVERSSREGCRAVGTRALGGEKGEGGSGWGVRGAGEGNLGRWFRRPPPAVARAVLDQKVNCVPLFFSRPLFTLFLARHAAAARPLEIKPCFSSHASTPSGKFSRACSPNHLLRRFVVRLGGGDLVAEAAELSPSQRP